jgi:hypothetical protein
MISYAQAEVFDSDDQLRFKRATRFVDALPSKHQGDWVRCHEVVRALGPLLGLTWCDGYYGMVEHSWLWLKPLEPFSSPPNILDVYCPGRLPQVQLVHSSTVLPYEYRRAAPRDDIRDSVVTMLQGIITALV